MQIGHPLLLFPLPLVLIYRAGQRLAKRKARKEKQVKSGFAAPMNATPPNAGTQFFEVCLSAQPVEGHRTFSAVRGGGPPVLGDLTPSCQITPQRFFFCTVSGTFSFWQDKKKMWGTFCTAKPCFLSWKPGLPFALLRRDQNNLLVKCQNPWYDNMKNLKGCLR